MGAMVHETVHVVQHYNGRGNPGWLVEGVSDYIRFFKFEPGKIGRINPERAHYNGSYRVTAAFLAYVTDKYDKQLVQKLNKVMREGRYKKEIFQELTGKSLEDLDKEWTRHLDASDAVGSELPRHAPARAFPVPAKNLPVAMVVISQHAHHDDRDPDDDRPAPETCQQVQDEMTVTQQERQHESARSPPR